jgi:hypothetical protein
MHCPGLEVQACHAKKSQNIGAHQDFTDFRLILAVNISAPWHPIKKWKKTKMITITVQYQFFYF